MGSSMGDTKQLQNMILEIPSLWYRQWWSAAPSKHFTWTVYVRPSASVSLTIKKKQSQEVKTSGSKVKGRRKKRGGGGEGGGEREKKKREKKEKIILFYWYDRTVRG